MDLILETPGIRVNKKQEMLHISVPKNSDKDIPIREVESIIADNGVQITSQALKLISSYAINIIYTSRGRPFGIYTPFVNTGTVFTRRQQILAYEDWRGCHLAFKFVYATLENKRRLLLYFAKNRKTSNKAKYLRLKAGARSIGNKINILLKGCKAMKSGTTINDIRQHLMGIEGSATKTYFIEYGNLFPNEFWTITRSRRPPRDPLNSLLSLGYTVLQSYITIGIASAGLELYAGYLHSDRSGKPSLALDLLEEFRQPIIDRLIARLILKNQIKFEDFNKNITSVRLNDEKKKFYYSKIRKEILGKDTSKILFKNDSKSKAQKKGNSVRLNYKKHIISQARKITNFLVGKSSSYEPFLMNW